MPATSPAQALDLTLRGPGKTANPDIVLLDYRDKATFSSLWLQGLESGESEIAGQKIYLTDSTKQYLIIGNDPPDGIFDTKIPALKGINFRSHFTATSWLAAWKVKYSPTEDEKKNGAIEANARFAVIDPRKADMAPGVARALQTIFAAHDAAGSPLVPGATVLNDPSLKAICQWLHDSGADNRALAKDAPHLRELLKSAIWNELVSNREQHHALSNVLGPVILSGRKIDERCFDLANSGKNNDRKKGQSASFKRVSLLLRRLLSACGLVSWEDKKFGDKDPQISETGQGIQILLLDDQAQQGWEDWVRECLPDAAGTMQVAVDPVDLVDNIWTALAPMKDEEGGFTGYKNKDARFKLELPGLSGATNPVLLLDLRLFSSKADDERKFVKDKLLPLVSHFTDKPGLAWPGFPANDPLFQQAKSAVENGTLKPDTDEHHEVLTWLPRVVALADMSLPIILFSSTGRRDLVEPFKPYGNIITSFAKPRLADLANTATERADIRALTTNGLREAVGRAKSCLELRSKCLAILAASSQGLKVDGSKESLYAELYIDEDGTDKDPRFAVGGVYSLFSDKSDADEFEDLCVEHGIRYFEDRYFLPRSPQVLRKQQDSGASQLQEAADAFRKSGKFVEFGGVRLGIGNLEDEGHPLRERTEDLRYWKLLEAVLEVFICEVLPLVKNQYGTERIELAVYVGSRMVPFRGDGDHSYKGNIEIHRFRGGRDPAMLRSIGGRDVAPIILKILDAHRSLDSLAIDRAAALALPYKKGKKEHLDRVIHRPSRTILEFYEARDVAVELLSFPYEGAYGRVAKFGRGANGAEFLFVEVMGVERDVYCRADYCIGFPDLRLGDPVSLDLSQGPVGCQGCNVRLGSDEDLVEWNRQFTGTVSASFLAGRRLEDFSPDYRALHYIADQYLRAPQAFEQVMPTQRLSGQFEQPYSRAFHDNLLASRLLDSGETGAALRHFSLPDPVVQGCLLPSACYLMARRVGSAISRCSGNEYLKGMAESITVESAPAPVGETTEPGEPVPTTNCEAPAHEVPKPEEEALAGVGVPMNAWLGPVPTGMDSKRLIKAANAHFSGWQCQDQWAGGVESGWWLSLLRLDAAAGPPPETVTLMGHEFSIVEEVLQRPMY